VPTKSLVALSARARRGDRRRERESCDVEGDGAAMSSEIESRGGEQRLRVSGGFFSTVFLTRM